jgi:FPC/CPF motif-containing protein YcgG
MSSNWRSRVITGRALGTAELPSWAERSYETLRRQVLDDAYPCFFGTQAEKRGEMFYAFVAHGAAHTLVETMTTFAKLARLPAFEMNNMAVFFEPDPAPRSHREYHDLFWKTLQLLHDADTHPHADLEVDPENPAWEFCYQGIEMFVVCALPSFSRRRSRNLGPGMVLLFQPRSVFIDKITNKAISLKARQQVRKRLAAWDQIGAHPDLGVHGDPDNREWKQYFLPDENLSHAGVCPFSSRGSAAAGFPLTPTQEGLWFLWRMDVASGAWNISLAIEIAGALDAGKLRASLIAVVERQSVLRTRFLDIRGSVRQCVDADAAQAIDWEEHDLRECAQPMMQARELMQERGNLSFDLTGGGLVRATLMRLDDTRSALQLCVHQIIADIESLHLLRRELFESYAAATHDQTPDFGALPMQFGEYARQSRARVDTLAMERQLSFWRGQLGNQPDVLDLPLDYPPPAHRQSDAGRVKCVLTSALHTQVKRFASEHVVPPAIVMLSVFALLLQRYSGQSDVRIAVPLARRHPSQSALIGQFTNTIVIPLRVVSTGTFGVLVEQTQRQWADAQAHGDLPFARLVESLRIPRSSAVAPLCQVQFNEWPSFAQEGYGPVQTQALDDGVGRGPCELSLNVAIDRSCTAVFLDYRSVLFDVSTAQRLLAHYVELLQRATGADARETQLLACIPLSRGGDPRAIAA